jgi:L-rhamnose mutarotase
MDGRHPSVRDARSPKHAMGKTYVQTICLRDGCVAEYVAYHADSWPAVVKSLSHVGITELKIYMSGAEKGAEGAQTRLVIVMQTTDGFDPAVDFAKHTNSSPVVAEWERRMKEFQVPAPEALGHEWWTEMEEVFDLSMQLETADSRTGYKAADAAEGM